jgi:urea transporter
MGHETRTSSEGGGAGARVDAGGTGRLGRARAAARRLAAGALAQKALRSARWALAGYAQVLFNTRPAVGLLVAAATFVNPEHGLSGLLGLVSANLGARLLELDEGQRHGGFYAFNGLLVGLALGLYYRVNLPFLLIVAVAGVLAAALAEALRLFFARSLGVPVLSLPFLLVSWALYAAAARLPGLEVTVEPVWVAQPWAGALPPWLDTVVRSFGAIYFQLNVPAGLLVMGALLLWSRLAFLLGLLGYATGVAVYLGLGGALHDVSAELLGLNFIAAAVALGGVWTVPTLSGVALAAVAGALTAVVGAASLTIFGRVGLPALAFPFIATTQLVILALRGRSRAVHLRQPALPGATPEATLREERTRRERFVPADRLGLPLPVGGRWLVTQAFDGPHTHRGDWRHGLDLEAVDEDGRRYRTTGTTPEDFYAFGAPVFAPLAGRVVAVVSHLPDNPVGTADAAHPWGNTVVLWHGEGAYSACAHLSAGSVVVELGMDVAAGALLGRVGSSGRAPTPHLHLQAQTSAAVGAPTVPWTLLHWVTVGDAGAGSAGASAGDGANGSGGGRPAAVYHTHGVPAEGTQLEPVLPSARLARALAFPLGQRWRWRLVAGGRERTVTWRAELDFASRLWLVEQPGGARLRLYRSPFVLLAEAYEGPRDAALHQLYRALPRVPLTDRDGVVWEDTLEPDGDLSLPRRALASLLLPAGRPARLETRSELRSQDDGARRVETRLRPAGPLAAGLAEWRAAVVVHPEDGLVRIEGPRFVATLEGVEVGGGAG